MLSIYDTFPLSFSPSYRLVLAVGKFGVSRVPQPFSAHWANFDGGHHLHLVDCALTYLDDILTNDFSARVLDDYPEQQEFLGAMFNFLISVIDTTPIRPQYRENEFLPLGLPTHITDLFVHCLCHTVSLCASFFDSHFVLPAASIVRLSYIPKQHHSQDLGILHPISTCDVDYVTDKVLGALSSRLAAGDEAMYRSFVAGDWVTLLLESWLSDLKKQTYTALTWFTSVSEAFTMHGYMHGLSFLPPEARAKYVEYIHAPRNLIMLFLMVATDESVAACFYGNDMSTPRIRALMRVCPRHAAWAECFATLKGVVAWIRDPEGVRFPLEGFFGGRVVRVDNVEISLDDQLKAMLRQERVRARLELAELVEGNVVRQLPAM